MRNSRTLALVTAAIVLSAATTSAHRLDELLQAARIDVQIDRVEIELSLTPGTAVAGRVIDAIDRDRNGMLSDEERRAFADEVIAAVRLAADGRPLDTRLISSTFAEAGALKSGDGTIELRGVATLAPAPGGTHSIEFANTYRRDISVYLANALVPGSDRIVITGQGRDGDQSELTIAYVVNTERAWPDSLWLLGIAGAFALVASQRVLRTGHGSTKARKTFLEIPVQLSGSGILKSSSPRLRGPAQAVVRTSRENLTARSGPGRPRSSS